ncbi:flagellar biosynthesis repressor FlbT [Qipengyuania sp. DSG2-2]|uniref:flagellar biosynthesis repressor FlbT n=1 Tax=Qipengyuania sp. DGS2-2 TaxID=3349631 RepID=UPI0036D262F0
MAQKPHATHQTLSLRSGEQIFVNGALIEARSPCRLRFSPSASIVRSVARADPSEICRALGELYRETVHLESHPEALAAQRSEMIAALNTLVAMMRTTPAQAHCSRYVAALGQGDIPTALDALRALARLMQTGENRQLPLRKPMPQSIPLAVNT